MSNEGETHHKESQEDLRSLYEREISRALSPVWAKSTQELLPGHLPNKARGEYTEEELAQYQIAYGILGERVKSGEVEVIFESEEATPIQNSPLEGETIAIPRFKLVTLGGKPSETKEVLAEGKLAFDA